MKRIMFDDRFCLTEAVLNGTKTMTRRLAPKDFNPSDFRSDLEFIRRYAHFHVGEVIAVAQSYSNLGIEFVDYADPTFKKKRLPKWGFTRRMKGWKNKMYVRADVMPNQIKITGVRFERIQDISNDDCQREGIVRADYDIWGYKQNGRYYSFHSGKDAYASLIKKLIGKKAWHANPYVFVYTFELVK